MARVKPAEVFYIRDLDHANQTLGEMGGIGRSLSTIEGTMNAAIDGAKAKASADAAPLKKRLEAMGNGLAIYAEHNKGVLFGEKKTVESLFGQFGFRKSTELALKPKFTWAMVLNKLTELAFKEAIRTKNEVDKDVMRGWPEERLALVGARRVEKDVFWYELKEEELKDG